MPRWDGAAKKGVEIRQVWRGTSFDLRRMQKISQL